VAVIFTWYYILYCFAEWKQNCCRWAQPKGVAIVVFTHEVMQPWQIITQFGF